MQCEVISGFLIRHPCDYEAVHQCVYCGKNICENHARPAPEGEGMACTVCLAEEQRRSDRYRDDPYFYGLYHHHYYRPYSLFDDYRDEDYRAFERDVERTGAYEGDLEGT